MRSPFIRLPLALLFVAPVFIAQGTVWMLARSFGKVPVALLSLFIASVLGWAAYALYTQILAPVEGLIAGKRHLIIVPSEALSSLPFQVLVMRACHTSE